MPIYDKDQPSSAPRTQETAIEFLRARDKRVYDGWLKVAEAKLVREKLRECYETEGVNHFQSCRELVKEYLSMIRQPFFPQQKEQKA